MMYIDTYAILRCVAEPVFSQRQKFENSKNGASSQNAKTGKTGTTAKNTKDVKRENHENHKATKTMKMRKNARSAKTAKTAKPRRLYSSQLFAAFSISFCFLIECLCFSMFARSRFYRFLGFLGLPVSHFYASHRSGHDAQISCLDCVNLRLGYL